jgi:DNA-binding HxlR family transcriptional regulator
MNDLVFASHLFFASQWRSLAPMKFAAVGRQPCSIARTLAQIGDGWTLLILRDAFLGRRRFSDFEAGVGAQPTVISDRLKRLVEIGVLSRVEYQQYPSRHEYRLTDKGRDLQPVFLMLARWGDKHLDDGDGPPLEFIHTSCDHPADPTVTCGHCGEAVDTKSIRAEPGPALARHFGVER